MTHSTDYNELDAALRRCGSHWTGAQSHGLLCGRLAIHGEAAAAAWRDQVLEGLDPADALRVECEMLLDDLLRSTWQQLAERQSEFELLLPDDEDEATVRTRALADWCEGFLHGMVAEKNNAAIRERLAAEPLADVIRDMLEITRATVGEEDDEETNEAALTELVEYIRVAAQLAYEELADLREGDVPPAPDTLH